jgi:hypothetical protein
MKAQSATEYLMTYGWAILIVIIVAAAFYAMGIFNLETYIPKLIPPTASNCSNTPYIPNSTFVAAFCGSKGYDGG